VADYCRPLPTLDALAEFSSEADHQGSVGPLKGPWDTSPAPAGMPLASDSLAALQKTIRGVANEVEALSTAIVGLSVWIIGLTVLVGASIFIVFAEKVSAFVFELTNIVWGG
jgi:hypothetical protein